MVRCRDCALYDLPRVQNKRGAVMSDRVAKCLWVSTEVWPVHVSYGSRRAAGAFMAPNDEHDCQVFRERQA